MTSKIKRGLKEVLYGKDDGQGVIHRIAASSSQTPQPDRPITRKENRVLAVKGVHPHSFQEVVVEKSAYRYNKKSYHPGDIIVVPGHHAATENNQGSLLQYTQTLHGWVISKTYTLVVLLTFEDHLLAIPVCSHKSGEGLSDYLTEPELWKDYIAVKYHGSDESLALGRFDHALETVERIQSGITICISDALTVSYHEEISASKNDNRLTSTSAKELLHLWTAKMSRAADIEANILDEKIASEERQQRIRDARRSGFYHPQESELPYGVMSFGPDQLPNVQPVEAQQVVEPFSERDVRADEHAATSSRYSPVSSDDEYET